MSDVLMSQTPDDLVQAPRTGEELEGRIAPLPRISIQAFCETQEVANMIEEAAEDRRLTRTIAKTQMGGISAALEAFRDKPTPNLLIIETLDSRDLLFRQLESLAAYCDPDTKVVVIGQENDITLYRDLLKSGVSDYIVKPVRLLAFIAQISALYAGEIAQVIGRTIGVVGAKGGVGASTIAHNLAWSITRSLKTQGVIVDLDLPFGTTALDFNQDPPQGVADAIYSPDRIDETFVDRLTVKCSETLSILAAPVTLDRLYDLPETAVDATIDILRATTPVIVLDIPHQWTAWTRHTMGTMDELVIVTAPDLANLRNAKALLQTLKAMRRNDRPPHIILNTVGMPKRPEISPAEFAKTLDAGPLLVSPFDAKLYGAAANNGQMLDEIDSSAKIVSLLASLGYELMGRVPPSDGKTGAIGAMLARLGLKKTG